MNDIFKYNRSESEDYYKLLGCTINSTEDQIQKEYKIRALELHPDKIISDPCRNEDEKVVCNEKFQALKKAKEVLLDKEKRNMYDRWLLGGMMMTFEQFSGYTKNNCQCFHWAAKKSDLMITSNNDHIPTSYEIEKSSSNQEKRNSKLNLKDTPLFKTNDFVWSTQEKNDLLTKFRNYEI